MIFQSKFWKRFYSNRPIYWAGFASKEVNNEENQPNKFGGYISLLAFLLLLPLQITEACGPTNRSFQGYSFLNYNIVEHKEGFAPWFLNFGDVYHDFFEQESTWKLNANLAEWQERFCGLVRKQDLSFIIYQASTSDLEALKTAIRSESIPMPNRLRGNSFADFAMEKQCFETIDYLIFAKRCEPHVIKFDSWSGAERDFSTMLRLIREGRKEFKKTKSPYMKLRYAYQLIRLAHYAKEYQLCLDLYDFLMPKVDKDIARLEESILKYWILGHKAGALQGLGKNVEAAYLFSLIFEHCPSKRESAFRSFTVQTDEEWEQLYLRCESDHQRAVLHAIRANASDARAVEEMRKIYELDPRNEDLELLLVKEMKKLERNLLGLEFNDRRRENRRNHGIPKPYIEDYLIEFQEFVRKLRQEKEVARPTLWWLAEGYLELLAGDFYAAGKTFEEVERRINDEKLKQQLITFQLVLKIDAFKESSPRMENEIYEVLMEDTLYQTFPDFPDFLRDKLKYIYEKEKNYGKAFLASHPISDLKPNPKEEILRDLLKIVEKKKLSSLERVFTSDHNGDPLANVLWDMRATNLMQDFQTEAALEAFKNIPRDQWDEYGVFEPFRESFKDCINCVFVADTSRQMNKGELMERMLDLEYKARGSEENNAAYFYNLGLAVYNTTYFGQAWKALDHFRSGSSWSRLDRESDSIFPSYTYPFGNKEHLDVTKALYYFEKTRLLASTHRVDSLNNFELAARAAFMAAKCEQSMYFTSKDYKPESCCNRIPQLPTAYSQNFERLKNDFYDTRFYEFIIEECKYFEAYLRR